MPALDICAGQTRRDVRSALGGLAGQRHPTIAFGEVEFLKSHADKMELKIKGISSIS
jgi:hypothetical protein